MLDLDTELEKLGKKDDGAGALVRNNRLLGMLANVFYRDLREVDSDFVERYLLPYLETKATFAGRIQMILEPSMARHAPDLKGLDAFEAVSPVAPVGKIDVEPLVVKLAASHGQAKVGWKSPEGADVEEERALVLADLLEAMSDAAGDARVDRQAGNLQDRPRKLLEQASKSIRRAAGAYVDVRSLNEFKHDQFQAARQDIDAALAVLDAAAAQK
jgi:hypothetical protein